MASRSLGSWCPRTPLLFSAVLSGTRRPIAVAHVFMLLTVSAEDRLGYSVGSQQTALFILGREEVARKTGNQGRLNLRIGEVVRTLITVLVKLKSCLR